jgi:hypothetical protein
VTVTQSSRREGFGESLVSILVIAKPAEADLGLWYEIDDEAFEEIRNLLDSLESGERVAARVGIGDPRLMVSSGNFVVLCRRLSPKDDPRATHQPVYLIARIISMPEMKDKQHELPDDWLDEYKGWAV